MAVSIQCAFVSVLLIILGSLHFQVEGATVPVPCSSPVDIIFLIASSNENGTLHYKREKQLTKLIGKRLGISSSRSRASIIMYDETARIKAHLDDHSDGEYFLRTINSLPREFVRESPPRLDIALRLAHKEVILKARDTVANVAVVLYCGPQHTKGRSGDLKKVVDKLRKAKVRVLAVGVGDGADASELSLITESENDILLTRKFGNLAKTADAFVERACPKNELEICPFPMDIVFVMDSSGSLGTRGYRKEMYFVNRLVQSLNMSGGHNMTRGAIILYGSTASVEVHFHENNSTEEFQRKVQQLPYYRGKTRTDEGLLVTIKQVLPRVRREVIKFALVFVNGQPDAEDVNLKELSDTLRGEGVRVLALGIGTKKSELRSMVESESDIVLADDLDNLISNVKRVAKHICIPAPERCRKPIDMVFIMDASDSIGETLFEKQKTIVKLVAQRLRIARSHSRAAIILAGTSASVEARFDEYPNTEEFVGVVNKLRYIGGQTRIDEALDLAYNDVFNMSLRTGVDRIAIVVTDGHQSKVLGSEISLTKASEPLRESGVRIIAVGIGREVDKPALRSMVQSQEDITMAENFGEVELQVIDLYHTFCPDKANVRRCNNTVDVVFVMDTSGSIGHMEYSKEKDFVKMMATSLGISQGRNRGAIVLYNGRASIEVGFDQHTSLAAFLAAVSKLPYEKGQRRRIDKALALVHSEVFSKSRNGASRVAIVLTDGRQTPDPDTKSLTAASEPLKRAGVRILAAGVGAADRKELRLMTESDSDVFFAKDFGQLKLQAQQLANKACDEVPSSRIEECTSIEASFCHVNASCMVKEGYYTCECKAGYQGNGNACTDIDECESPEDNKCHGNAECINNLGSYSCDCDNGYSGDGFNCTERSMTEDLEVDIVFAMDSSSSVGSQDFAVQQEFVKSVARFLNVAPGKSRAGVFSYGEASHRAVTFESYKTVEEFEAGVDKAQLNGGQRRIDQVLSRAANLLAFGNRPGVSKILLLLTTGKPSRTPGGFPMIQLAQILREPLKTRTYVIGIGKAGSDFGELDSLVNNTDDIYTVPSFDVLVSQAKAIAAKIASHSGKTGNSE